MGILLLAAFIAVPLIEIALFIEVGGAIGLWPTLAIVVMTAIAGSGLLRHQGTATLARARRQLDNNVLPARELFDGVCLLFAGALLLTPGFFTDTVGLLLFVPAVRDMLRTFAARYVETHAEARVFVDGEEIDPRRGGPGRHRRPHPRDDVIDADFREVDGDDNSDDSRDGTSGRLP
jgi:UPF0716 protein FxsA